MSDPTSTEEFQTAEAFNTVEHLTEYAGHDEFHFPASDPAQELRVTEAFKIANELIKYVEKDEILYNLLLEEEDRCDPPSSSDIVPSLPWKTRVANHQRFFVYITEPYLKTIVSEKYPELADKIEAYRQAADKVLAKEPNSNDDGKDQVMAWGEVIANMAMELRQKFWIEVYELYIKNLQRLVEEMKELQLKKLQPKELQLKEMLIRKEMAEGYSACAVIRDTCRGAEELLRFWPDEG